MSIKTHEICADGMTPYLVKKLARAFSVAEGTVRAWCHPKESDLDPTGTGKRNPLDQAERYLRVVHPSNPGNVRQAAQYLMDVVDEMDHAAGVTQLEKTGRILNGLREIIREHTDIATVLLSGEFDDITLRNARKEIAEARSALERLDAALKAKLDKSA